MLTEINRANFEGKQVVTCFTCHKGHAIPEDIPAMPAPPIKADVEAGRQGGPALPTVDQVLSKYITALGGEQAMRKVTTRVITGTQDLPTGPGGTVPTPAKLERSLKAPNLVVDVYTADKFTISSGFDGKAQWAKGQNGNVNSPIGRRRRRRAGAARRGLQRAAHAEAAVRDLDRRRHRRASTGTTPTS